MIAFVSDPRFVEHQTGPHHPERPDRLRAIHRAVRQSGWVTSPDPFPDFYIDLGALPPAPFPAIEIPPRSADLESMLAIHPEKYIQRIRHICDIGGVIDNGDTVVSRASFDTAILSAGAVLTACDAVMTGQSPDGRALPSPIRRAFVAARPPGHHAEAERAMGFCLFANIAIGARYIQRKYGIERIAIVDFDVHHGNGTQAVLESDPTIFFASMHQHPSTCYPGSGFEWEIGVGAGRGHTLNVPFHPGAGDEEYLEALEKKVIPALDAFNPQVLMISAGFDAHHEDPLADIQLTEFGFEQITRELVRLADRRCAGRVVSVLEGGYNLRALGRSVAHHLIGLSEGLTQ